MRAFAITMVILLMISQVSKANKLALLKKGIQPEVYTEGVYSLSLLVDMCLMAWGVAVLLS